MHGFNRFVKELEIFNKEKNGRIPFAGLAQSCKNVNDTEAVGRFASYRNAFRNESGDFKGSSFEEQAKYRNIEDKFFKGSAIHSARRKNEKVQYFSFTEKGNTRELSINEVGFDATVPINALNLGVLFKQRYQFLPKQPVFEKEAGVYRLKLSASKELDINDIIPEATREAVVANGYLVDTVRYSEQATQNIVAENEDDLISDMKADIQQYRSYLNPGAYNSVYQPLNKYLKTVTRNIFKEELFASQANFATSSNLGEIYLRDAMGAEVLKEKLLKTAYYMARLLAGPYISSSVGVSSPASGVDYIMKEIFFDASTSQFLRFEQMNEAQLAHALDKLKQVLSFAGDYQNPYIKPVLFIPVSSYIELQNRQIRDEFRSGSGINNNFYRGMSYLEAIKTKGAEATGDEFQICVVSDFDNSKNPTYTPLYSKYPSLFGNSVRSYALIDMGLTSKAEIIKEGVFSRSGLEFGFDKVFNKENYVFNSPVDCDLTMISTFTDLLVASFNRRGSNYDLFARFDFQS